MKSFAQVVSNHPRSTHGELAQIGRQQRVAPSDGLGWTLVKGVKRSSASQGRRNGYRHRVFIPPGKMYKPTGRIFGAWGTNVEGVIPVPSILDVHLKLVKLANSRRLAFGDKEDVEGGINANQGKMVGARSSLEIHDVSVFGDVDLKKNVGIEATVSGGDAFPFVCK